MVAMKVSVVIPTKDRPNELKECIEALLKQTRPIDELVIVDGSTSEEISDEIKKFISGIRIPCIYIREREGGLARARNIGARYAQGDIVVYVDDDVILGNDWVEKAVKTFKKYNKVGGLGGEVLAPVEKKALLFSKVSKIWSYLFLRDSIKKGSVTIAGHLTTHPNKLSFVEWLGTSAVAYKKDVLKEFKFDERLELAAPYAYYDDFDFSYRVGRKYKLLFNPELKAVHRASRIRLDQFKLNRAKILNHYYIVKKYRFNVLAFWWSTFGLLLAHIILLLVRPSKANYMALAGLIDGIKKIVKGGWI